MDSVCKLVSDAVNKNKRVAIIIPSIPSSELLSLLDYVPCLPYPAINCLGDICTGSFLSNQSIS